MTNFIDRLPNHATDCSYYTTELFRYFEDGTFGLNLLGFIIWIGLLYFFY